MYIEERGKVKKEKKVEILEGVTYRTTYRHDHFRLSTLLIILNFLLKNTKIRKTTQFKNGRFNMFYLIQLN